MTEKTKNTTAAALARELASAHIRTGTLSAPRRSGTAHSIAVSTADSPADTTAAGTPQPAGAPQKIRVRAVVLKSGLRWQIEEFRGVQSFHRNVDASELEAELELWFSGSWGRAEFACANKHYTIMTNRRGELTVFRKSAERGEAEEPGSTSDQEQDAEECRIPAHDKAKHYILAEGTPVPFLVDLGVMTKDGWVVKARYDKFRQINRFLEFIEDILPEFDAEAGTERPLSVIDFGCGKSYLTFAVYYYLTVVKKLNARVTGLDLKTEVIGRCAALADAYGYQQLSFEVGDIARYSGAEQPDLVISLHACDTATDFALARSVQWNARVILAVPCCQHEINAQLGDPPVTEQQKEESRIDAGESSRQVPGRAALEGAFRFGIVRERIAALLTDAMRAEALEDSGYRVQILEFIDMTHTPKNLLIRAVRKHDNDAGTPDGRTPEGESGRHLRTKLGAAFGVQSTLEMELERWKKSL